MTSVSASGVCLSSSTIWASAPASAYALIRHSAAVDRAAQRKSGHQHISIARVLPERASVAPSAVRATINRDLFDSRIPCNIAFGNDNALPSKDAGDPTHAAAAREDRLRTDA
jgi:hypothetical protein